LVLYAKQPVAGQVKTRLHPILSPEQSRALYQVFVEDTVEMMGRLSGVSGFIACHPSASEVYFQDLARRYSLNLLDQGDGDLGQRMERTIRSLIGEGWDHVVLIGADSPSLPTSILEGAFRTLSGETAKLGPSQRVVFGPTFDGGYYLVGISGEVPPIFEGIPWSTPLVLEQTLGRLHASKISHTLLPFWYDVDTPEDFRFLVTHLRYLSRSGTETARHTSRFLGSLKGVGVGGTNCP
jgi:hypothetical protein